MKYCCLFFLFLTCSSKPLAIYETGQAVDIKQTPIQMPINNMTPIEIEIKMGECFLEPVAYYHIAAKVQSKKRYRGGWDGDVIPFDLVLTWGMLAEPEFAHLIKYNQADRWYWASKAHLAPIENDDIVLNSSNNHIISKSQNILMVLENLKLEQDVLIEGYLVNVYGEYVDKPFFWRTSISRTDRFVNACEIIYVEKIQVGNKVFE